MVQTAGLCEWGLERLQHKLIRIKLLCVEQDGVYFLKVLICQQRSCSARLLRGALARGCTPRLAGCGDPLPSTQLHEHPFPEPTSTSAFAATWQRRECVCVCFQSACVQGRERKAVQSDAGRWLSRCVFLRISERAAVGVLAPSFLFLGRSSSPPPPHYHCVSVTLTPTIAFSILKAFGLSH